MFRICHNAFHDLYNINYRPIPEITIKAEGGVRLLHSQYNQEPWFALGITWAAFFKTENRKLKGEM